MAKYVLSPEAAKSIAQIEAYTCEQFGPKQAVRYLENLLDRFEFIAEDPKRGKHRLEIDAAYFSYFVGSHTVYYIINAEQIQIVDVLHQSMEPTRYLLK